MFTLWVIFFWAFSPLGRGSHPLTSLNPPAACPLAQLRSAANALLSDGSVTPRLFPAVLLPSWLFPTSLYTLRCFTFAFVLAELHLVAVRPFLCS